MNSNGCSTGGGSEATKVYGRVWTFGRLSLAYWRKPGPGWDSGAVWRASLRGVGWAAAWCVSVLASAFGVVVVRAEVLTVWSTAAGCLLIWGGLTGFRRALDGVLASCQTMWRAARSESVSTGEG